MKKRIGLIFAIIFFSMLGFSACGNPYKKMGFSLSSERDLTQTIELYLNKSEGATEYDKKDSFVINATVSGVGKGVSTDVVVPEFNQFVDVAVSSKSGSTSKITITAKSEGETVLAIQPKENPDGKFTKYVKIKVCVGLQSFRFKENAFSAIAMGENINLNVDPRTFINFYPAETSRTNIEYSIVYPEGSTRDYAEIRDNVLYTYKNKTYPEPNGVKIVTLQARSKDIDMVDSINITIIDVEHEVNVTTEYGSTQNIVLSKNNSNKYEVLLANPEINVSGGTINLDDVKRVVRIGLGDENAQTNKYRISIEGDYSFTADKPIAIEKYDDQEYQNVFSYRITAKKRTRGTDVTFKIEYIGDANDNPENDLHKFDGLFTKYVTFTFYVYDLPKAENLLINDKADDNQIYTVYDTYFKSITGGINENGTPIKVQENKSTLPNLRYTISYDYEKSGLKEGLGVKGLQIMVDGKLVSSSNILANASTMYLKHAYSADDIAGIDPSNMPYITVSLTYSLAPSNATEDQQSAYGEVTISKKIYLQFKAGIKEINLPTDEIGLEITKDEYIELYSFPEEYKASETVEKVVGRNLDLIDIKYVANKIYIKSNTSFRTGEVTLSIIANNGKQSNYAKIVVYLPVLYEGDDTLYVDVDKTSDAVFVVGKMTGEGEEYEATTKTINCNINDNEFTYTTITDLILQSNSKVRLDVYSILEDNGQLKYVLPNVDINAVINPSQSLLWNVELVDNKLQGVLYTYSAPADKKPITLTFTLSGYKTDENSGEPQQVTYTHTINVWVFDAIKSIEFRSQLNETYLSNSLGYEDKEAGKNKYLYEWIKNPMNAVEGNFEFDDIELKNANQVSHSVNLNAFRNVENGLGSDLSKAKVLDWNNKERLRKDGSDYYIDIYMSDILSKIVGEKENGFSAEIFVKFTITKIVGDKEVEEEMTLLQLFEAMYDSNVSEYTRKTESIRLAFGASENNNYRDFVLEGSATQFGRGKYVSTNIRVINPVMVKSIDTSVGVNGLYFEKETGANLSSQTFTYSVLPTNAYNKGVIFKVYTAIKKGSGYVKGDEQNLYIVSSQNYTLSSQNTITIDNITYYFNTVDKKLYKSLEDGVYSDEVDYEYNIIDANTIAVSQISWTYTGNNKGITNVAKIEIVENQVKVEILQNVVGDYIIEIIAKDSIISATKYSVTKDVVISIGDGTKENPFQIRSISDLIKMWNRNIGGENEYCYRLQNNINVTNNNFADYLLNNANVFAGDFDGNGKYIAGLTANYAITKTGDYIGGLFAKVEHKEDSEYSIHDLTLKNINYNIKIATKEQYSLSLGGLAGIANNVKLDNLFVSGNINVSYDAKITEEKSANQIVVGGIVAKANKVSLSAKDSINMFADDVASNIATTFDGLTADKTQGKHIIGGVFGTAENSTVTGIKVSGKIQAISGGDDANISNATLGGVAGETTGTFTAKDVRVTPSISGYKNVAGVVGESQKVTFEHVVVEFLYNDNYKNSIMGYDNVAGFVANAQDKVEFVNSYIRAFGGTQVDATYDSNKYCGNIIVRQASSINTSIVGGLVASTNADIAIKSSYVMADIKSYATTTKEYIGGFVGNSNNNILIDNAYFIGNIYSRDDVPKVILGNDIVPTQSSGSVDAVSVEFKEDENTLTEDKNVGEYIRYVATKTESVSYTNYAFDFGTNVSINQFYAVSNSTFSTWENTSNVLNIRTPKSMVVSKIDVTFAVFTEEDKLFVYTVHKNVFDYGTGKHTRYNLFKNGTIPAGANNYIPDDKVDMFKDLGFDGNVQTDLGGNDRFFLNAYAINVPENISTIKAENLLYSAISKLDNSIQSGQTAEDYSKILLEKCDKDETEVGAIDITDAKDISMENLFATKFEVNNIRPVVYIKEGEQEIAILENVTISDYVTDESKVTFTLKWNINDTNTVTLYYNGNTFFVDSAYENEFSGYFAIINENYIPLYYTENSTTTTTYDKLTGTDGNTYYLCIDSTNEDKYGSIFDSIEFTNEVGSNKIEFAIEGNVCDLVIGENTYFTNVTITLSENNTVMFNGVESKTIKENGSEYVTVVLTKKQLAMLYNFAYTNGQVGSTANNYVMDNEGNIIAKVNEDGKYVLDNKNALWFVDENVNNGLPVLIRRLAEGETAQSLDVLYDSVSKLNVKVTDFNYNGSSDLNELKQGYVKLSDSEVVLFYNKPNGKYDGQNTYVIAGSDAEKAELDAKYIGGQAPIVLSFADVFESDIFKLNDLHEYIIKSNNANILSVEKFDGHTSLVVNGTGLVKLTFTNKYDGNNTFEITIYIVNGLSGVESINSMTTYVNKAKTYSYGFNNTLVEGTQSFVFDANVGGYKLSLVESSNNTAEVSYNGTLLNEDSIGEEYDFDMSNPIVLMGQKAGKLQIKLVPYIKYSAGIFMLDYMSEIIDIEVFDLAKSISVGTNNASTIKPEGNTSVSVEIVSSNKDEEMDIVILDRNGNVVSANNTSSQNLFDMINVFVVKDSEAVAIQGTKNLYRIKYTLYLEMNIEKYYDEYKNNGYTNPLEEALKYNFTFIPKSWSNNGVVMEEYADQVAKFALTIEANTVSNVVTSFFNLKAKENDRNVYTIDTNAEYVSKMEPGKTGLIRLKVMKDYNNLSYIAIKSNNDKITLRQANINGISNPLEFVNVTSANTRIENGIKLWSLIYSGDTSHDYANFYYVFIDFDSSITEGSMVDLQIIAYGKNDSVLLSTNMSIEVDVMPHIYFTNLSGQNEDYDPVGEYKRVLISTANVEDTLTWDVDTVGKLYDFAGKQATLTNTNTPYLCYKISDRYTRIDYTFNASYLSQELYIFVPKDAPLTTYKFVVSGYRIVNTSRVTTTGTFTLETRLFDIENVYVNGTSPNLISIKFSNYTSLSASVELNTQAQSIYNGVLEKLREKNISIDELIYSDIAKEVDKLSEIDATDFDKALFKSVIKLVKYNNGQSSAEDIKGTGANQNNTYHNGWYTLDGDKKSKNETSTLLNKDAFYPTVDGINLANYQFFLSSTGKMPYYGINALKISNNNMQFKFDYNVVNGVPVIDNSNDPKHYKIANFTLQITDNSSVDHPNPIRNVSDFVNMCSFMTEDSVNEQISNNPDIDPTELNFGNYILLCDLVLEKWAPRDIYVSSFNANGFTITINSWDFSGAENNAIEAGLFRKIGQYTVIQNLNVDISKLVSDDASSANAKTKFTIDGTIAGEDIREVTFGVVAAQNEGVISNVRVVNFTAPDKSTNNNYLNIYSKQGYSNGEMCSATIAGFVAQNSGAISDSFVGLNAVDYKKDGYSYIKKTKTESNENKSENTKVYPFTLVGGNKISGFVASNTGIISNSYVMGVSVENTTNIQSGSTTAGFVGQNSNNATIYSCFVSGSEYSAYGDDIVNLRATKTHISSKGNVGGFVYDNQGTIENAYSMVDIIVQTVYSAGFAFENKSTGVIKNAYTTSVTSNINSRAHGRFVKNYEAGSTLQNAYYLIVEEEMGITSTNATQDVLKSIDPAKAIISEASPSDIKVGISFANSGSFEGFTFASSSSAFDGIWILNNNRYPTLLNTVNCNIESVRTLTNKSTESASEGDKLKYDYRYTGPNIGTKQNPIIISQPSHFAKYIVENSNRFGNSQNDYFYLFGGRDDTSPQTYNPRYIKLVNNISLAKISLNNTYKCNNEDDQIPLSKVVFAGYIIGNGMTISDITLNNTNTSGNNLEDFGLFKQIGMTNAQEGIFKGKTNIEIISPTIYNVNFNYNELSDSRANKVGLLAGSVYKGILMGITIEGKKSATTSAINTISGYNLVGGLAGLISGNGVIMNDITIKNVRVTSTNNKLSDFSDSYEDTGAYYEEFGDIMGNKRAYNLISFDENGNIKNLNQISYAGGVAGVILANNIQVGSDTTSAVTNVNNMSTYKLTEYRNNAVSVHDIIVRDNVEISGDMAGGLFGYIGNNTHLRNSYFMLMQGSNNVDTYQRIYGRAFGGAIAGQVENAILERVNVRHLDSDYQDQIDLDIAQITSDKVSKNDLFLNTDSGVTVSVAIGGIAGRGKNVIILDSFAKVNVYNLGARIAGGLMGYAEGKIGVAYSFATGNVRAKEIVGGLVGFYRYNSFDMYLNNAIAENVWGSEVVDTLRSNLTAIYGVNVTDYDVRMPELGNQMTEYSLDNIPTITKRTNSISNQNSRFVYMGSVLGKAVLNAGTYVDSATEKTLFTVTGNTISTGANSASLKNMFVHSSVGSNIAVIENNMASVRLFTSTYNKDTEKYVVSTNNTSVSPVCYNISTDVNADSKKTYYFTYYGEQFYNVYSSVYGTTTRTGEMSEGNMVSSFSGLTPNNAEVTNTVKELDGKYYSEYQEADNTADPPEIEKKVLNNNVVRYSTLFGTQYPISKMTGYYYVSVQNGVEYEEYINIFGSAVGFGYDISKENLLGCIGKVNTNGSDLITEVNSAQANTPSQSWYFNEETGLLEYESGKAGQVTVITTHNQLIEVLNSNTKGKSYTLSLKESGNAIQGGENNYTFPERFRGVLSGDTSLDEARTVYISSFTNQLFESLEGATISNVIFEFDMSTLSGNKASVSTTDTFGFFASYIERTTFENCKFVFKNVNFYMWTYLIKNNGSLYDNTAYMGFLFGKMTNSTLENCEIKIEFEGSGNTIKINNTATSIGFVAGQMTGGNISGLNITSNAEEFTLEITTGNFGKDKSNQYKFDESLGKITNIGTIVGEVSDAGIESVSSVVKLTAIGTLAGGSNVGGMVGKMTNSSITASNYNHLFDVNINVGNDNSATTQSATAVSIGGIVGYLYQGNGVQNSQFCGSMNNDGNYEDLSSNKSFNVIITNTSGSQKTYNIGGLMGYVKSYYTNGTYLINRVGINVTINKDVNGDKDDNVIVGGIIGAQGSTTKNNENLINTADVKVVVAKSSANKLQDTVKVGGLIGRTETGLNNSYMQGDVIVDGGKTVYEGALIGVETGEVTLKDNISYGDVKFTHNSGKYYLGGMIGGYIGSIEENSEMFTFENCRVLASVYEVEKSTYKMVEDDVNANNANKYDSNSYKAMYVNPFINVISENGANKNLNSISLSGSTLYIIEDYFDFYYEKQDASGKYFYDIYEGLKDAFIGLQNGEKINTETDYLIANSYYFTKIYGEGTKYNARELTKVTKDPDAEILTISGYNIITENAKIESAITICRNAVLAGKSTAGITLSHSGQRYDIVNKGVIGNIVFDYNLLGFENVISTNYGVLNNVVVKGTNNISSGNIGGLVGTNNGYVYRSGAVIVYTNLHNTSNVVTLGGLVHENNNVISTSYCSSMITGLRFDDTGKAYYNNIDNKLKINSGGIAYSNAGKIDFCAFEGTLYSKSISNRNVAFEGNGQITNTYSDPLSMYFEDNKTQNSSFETANIKKEVNANGEETAYYVFVINTGKNYNFHRYYINGGIVVSTMISRSEDGTITYFADESNIYPVFNIRDFNEIANDGSVSDRNNYVLLNDLYMGYKADMYTSANLSGTFYGNDYAIIGGKDSNSNILFSLNPNIYALTIRSFKTTKNSILLGNITSTPNTNRVLSGISFENCEIENNDASANVGLFAGRLTNYTIEYYTISSSSLVVTGTNIGLIAGVMDNCKVMGGASIIDNSSITAKISNGNMGLVGLAENSSFQSVISGYSVTTSGKTTYESGIIYEIKGESGGGTKYVGGIIGKSINSSIESCINVTDISILINTDKTDKTEDEIKNYISLGGIVGVIDDTKNPYTLKFCQNLGELVSEGITGGIVGTLKKGNIGFTDNSTFTYNGKSITGETAGGVVGIVSGDAVIKYCEVNIENGQKISGTKYAGGIIGHISGGKVEIYNCSLAGDVVECEGSSNFKSSAGGLIGSLGYVEYGKDLGIELYIENVTNNIKNVKSSYYAGGVAGYAYSSNHIAFNNVVINSEVAYKYHLNSDITDPKGNTIEAGVYTSDEWTNKIKYKYSWVVDGLRFGSLKLNDVQTNFFGYNKNFDSPIGYSVGYLNEDIKNWKGMWYGPYSTDYDGYSKTDESFNNRTQTTVKKSLMELWKSGNPFQVHKGWAHDDSLFYSNLKSYDLNNDIWWRTADMLKLQNFKSLSGFVFGGLYNSTDKMVGKTIDQIYGLSSNYKNQKYLINRYAQRFYSSIEYGSWENSGIMVIEYNIYANSYDLVGQQFGEIDGEDFIKHYWKDSEIHNIKNHLDIYVSTNLNYSKDCFFWSEKNENYNSNAFDLGDVYEINKGIFSGDIYSFVLYRDSSCGIIKNFYQALNTKDQANNSFRSTFSTILSWYTTKSTNERNLYK